jgi:hypothetical protein
MSGGLSASERPHFTQTSPGITQEVAPNESQRAPKPLLSKAPIYEALLWRFDSSVDLKRAHNPYLKAPRLARCSFDIGRVT